MYQKPISTISGAKLFFFYFSSYIFTKNNIEMRCYLVNKTSSYGIFRLHITPRLCTPRTSEVRRVVR